MKGIPNSLEFKPKFVSKAFPILNSCPSVWKTPSKHVFLFLVSGLTFCFVFGIQIRHFKLCLNFFLCRCSCLHTLHKPDESTKEMHYEKCLFFCVFFWSLFPPRIKKNLLHEFYLSASILKREHSEKHSEDKMPCQAVHPLLLPCTFWSLPFFFRLFFSVRVTAVCLYDTGNGW